MTDQSQAPLNSTQPWYASRTIWAIVVTAILPMVSAVLHVTISDADAQQIVAVAAGAGTLVGSGLAIYGRVVATKTITATSK